MASSTIMNISEDALHRLVNVVVSPSSPGNFKEECEASIASGDASNVLRTILRDSGSFRTLLSASFEDGVSAVSLLSVLLDKTKDGSSGQMLTEIADAIVKNSENDSSQATAKAVTLLATLYNMRSDPSEKVNLLSKMIRLASTRDPDILHANSSSLGKWMDPSRLVAMLDEWKIPPSGRRELYHAAADGAATPSAKQQFTLLVVETYSQADTDATALEYAKKAAVGAIRDPVSLFTQQRNILNLPAIQALGQTDAKLLALLKIFQEGKIEDFLGFVKSNGAGGIFADLGLSEEDGARYMRILSLCSLATEHEEIPYSLVAETLQTSPEEVEKWVIAAVSSGLLSAKMDQLEQKVMVERSVVRQFNMKEWKALQERIHLWKKNVRGILDAYKQSMQAQSEAAQ